MRRIILLVLACVCLRGATAQDVDPYANETEAQRDARMSWWREARFGLFIHWGVYAVPAGTYKGQNIGGIGEWIMKHGRIPLSDYKAYAAAFNPVNYDPDAWVRLAKEAGMKYIVITSKHHDGFALFDSKVTEWDIVDATPYGKDLLKPLAEACRKHGMKLGFYYSQAQDWTHPGGAGSGWDPAQAGDMTEYIKTIAAPQVREILSNYGDIVVLWWDTPANMSKERADLLLPLLRLQPGIIHNNRLGGGYRGDTETPEQHIPATGMPGRDWETCMTMNDTWGYKSYSHNWKSTEDLIRNLVDIASKGGNYLLNVGPTALGEIPQPSIDRLKEVGKWMKVNGESIYGTSASPCKRPAWGRLTRKREKDDTAVYFHIFDWNSVASADDETQGKLTLDIDNEVLACTLLADPTRKVAARLDGGQVRVRVSGAAPDPICSVVKLVVKGDLVSSANVVKQAADGSLALNAADADGSHLGSAQVEIKEGKANIGYWNDAQSWVEWTAQVTAPGTFRVSMDTASTEGDAGFMVSVSAAKATTPLATLKGATVSTGSYETFRTAELGPLSIPEAGLYKISLKPEANGWKPMNLRALKLSPVK